MGIADAGGSSAVLLARVFLGDSRFDFARDEGGSGSDASAGELCDGRSICCLRLLLCVGSADAGGSSAFLLARVFLGGIIDGGCTADDDDSASPGELVEGRSN